MTKSKTEKVKKSDGNNSTNVLQLLVLFVLWYGFNAGYNVYNAKLKVFPYPVTISSIQLVVGYLYAVPLWLLAVRSPPKLTFSDLVRLFPLAALNALGHSITVVAMFQKGGGSFAHVIKATEPVVSVILGLLINGVVPKPLTSLTLLPICYGVAYASTLGQMNITTMSKELTSLTAIFAMIGNVAFALRSILRKNLTDEFKIRKNFTAVNDHAVITFYSFVLTLPVIFLPSLLGLHFPGEENPADMISFFQNHLSGEKGTIFLRNAFICGMCYYIYNEMQNQVLGSLGAVTTAVANTLKRVAIFVALYMFIEGESFPWPKIIGCAIAITGCLLYAICDSKKL